MTARIGMFVSLVAVVLGASNAFADEKRFHVDLAVTGGGLLPVGTPRNAMGGAGEIDLRLLWRVGRVVQLGLRGSLAIGGIPWNYEGIDGEYAWVPGGNDPCNSCDREERYGMRTTVAPLGGFVAVFDLGSAVTLDVLAGLGNVLPATASDSAFYQYAPGIATGLGLSVDLGRSGPVAFGLVLRVDYITSWLNDCKGYVLPQAGLRLAF